MITETLPHVRSVALGLSYRLGGRDDPDERTGAAHLVEHMVFQGSPGRDAKAIAIAAESRGAELNAFTDKEFTCFYGRFPADQQAEVARLLGEVVAGPGFGEQELAKEKQVIGEEIRTADEDPDSRSSNLLFTAFYDRHPMGAPIAGTKETLAGLEVRWLRDFYADRYHAGSGVAVAVGEVRHEELAEELSRALGSVPVRGNPQRREPQMTRARVLAERRNELSQAFVCLCRPAFRYTDPRRYALSVFNTAFGGGVASRLFQRLREDEGLVYSVSSFVELFEDSGLVGVYFIADKNKLERCIAVLDEETGRLHSDGLDEAEVERARNMTKSAVLLGLESPTSRMLRLARTRQMLGRVMTVDETLDRYNLLTPDEVNEAMRAVLTPGPGGWHGGAVGPLEPEAMADAIGTPLYPGTDGPSFAG